MGAGGHLRRRCGRACLIQKQVGGATSIWAGKPASWPACSRRRPKFAPIFTLGPRPAAAPTWCGPIWSPRPAFMTEGQCSAPSGANPGTAGRPPRREFAETTTSKLGRFDEKDAQAGSDTVPKSYTERGCSWSAPRSDMNVAGGGRRKTEDAIENQIQPVSGRDYHATQAATRCWVSDLGRRAIPRKGRGRRLRAPSQFNARQRTPNASPGRRFRGGGGPYVYSHCADERFHRADSNRGRRCPVCIGTTGVPQKITGHSYFRRG